MNKTQGVNLIIEVVVTNRFHCSIGLVRPEYYVFSSTRRVDLPWTTPTAGYIFVVLDWFDVWPLFPNTVLKSRPGLEHSHACLCKLFLLRVLSIRFPASRVKLPSWPTFYRRNLQRHFLEKNIQVMVICRTGNSLMYLCTHIWLISIMMS